MEDLTPEQVIQQQKDYINNEIDALKAAKAFPETVKKLMATPEWKEVIEKVYIDEFARDLVRSFDEFDETVRKDFDEEYKVRSRFLNCIQAWAEGADKANEQIERYQEMLESTEAQVETTEPTIGVK